MATARKEAVGTPQTDALKDLRHTIEFLRQEGDLIETDTEVNPDLEITGVQKHLDGSCPILFNKVKGKPFFAPELKVHFDKILEETA